MVIKWDRKIKNKGNAILSGLAATQLNCLITPAPNLCRGWVMADLQRIRQLLPIFTYASLRPSIRFFSTSRIESFDHRLIAMTRHTTSCAGSWR